MTTIRFFGVIAAACLSAFGYVACTKDAKTDNSCESNLDCFAPGTRCDLEVRQCVCATDEACADGFFCNRAGLCQAIAGCLSNIDCPREGTYCDAATGQCLPGPSLQLGSTCGLASHCPFGTICTDGSCVAGCFDDGDCPLGQVCLDGSCAGGDGVCADDSFCGYGERCIDSTSPATCRVDRRGPYCQGCSFRTVMNPEPCDHPRNFCLINSLEASGFRSFCGVDCSLGQECPNGYDCHGVVILTEDVCTFNAQCRCDPRTIRFATATCTVAAACDPRNPDGTPDTNASACVFAGQRHCNGGVEGGPASCIVGKDQRFGNCTCATNDECGEGGICVDGVCCSGEIREDRDCAVGENRVSGFCTCATDDDCPRDACDGSRGACAITGQPCTPGADDCGPIPCVDGGCVIGANCAPLQGLSCSVVTGG